MSNKDCKGITIEVRDGRNGGLKHMLKVSISLQKKKIEKAAALGVILIANEKNFIQVNVRCFLVEESHVILDKYIAKKKLQNIIRRYSHFPGSPL